jgi:hypothetical protein
MTPTDALDTVHRMYAMWPSTDAPSQATLDEWVRRLTPHTTAVVHQALGELERREQRLPTWAKLHEGISTILRRQALSQRALPPPPPSPEERQRVMAQIAELRSQLRRTAV